MLSLPRDHCVFQHGVLGGAMIPAGGYLCPCHSEGPTGRGNRGPAYGHRRYRKSDFAFREYFVSHLIPLVVCCHCVLPKCPLHWTGNILNAYQFLNTASLGGLNAAGTVGALWIKSTMNWNPGTQPYWRPVTMSSLTQGPQRLPSHLDQESKG